MKKILSVLLVFCLVPGSSAVAFGDARWAEENGLNRTKTVEDLYAAALAEGGILNPYGSTGRDETFVKIFVAAYPCMTDSPLGYGVSSKLRERDQQGYVLGVDPAHFEDQTPTTAVSFMIAQIADHCEHPNGAKLFVRWICGEAGGQGEGLAPFITAGSYPVFPSAPVADVEQPAFDSIPKFDLDLQYYYENYYDVYDYWLSVQP